MSLPFGRAINPVTGTNWEGTGVAPDIAVPQGQALDIAVMEALKALSQKETIPELKEQLEWALEEKQVERSPVALTADEMQTYAGTFGPRVITLEDGTLYYQREGMPAHRMIPLGNDRFILEDVDAFRLEFVRDEQGEIIAVVGHYQGRSADRHEKNK